VCISAMIIHVLTSFSAVQTVVIFHVFTCILHHLCTGMLRAHSVTISQLAVGIVLHRYRRGHGCLNLIQTWFFFFFFFFFLFFFFYFFFFFFFFLFFFFFFFFFSGFVCITAMIFLVFTSLFSLQIYDLPHIHLQFMVRM